VVFRLSTGMGIWQVKILVLVPVPVAVPMRNPRVYPYPCNTLGIHDGPGMEVQVAVLHEDRQYLIYIPGTTADTIC
jgi:hypothetical protein